MPSIPCRHHHTWSFEVSHEAWHWWFWSRVSSNPIAQDLGASLSDVDGRPGKQVVVNLTLSNNTTAAQAGFNITYNPKIADIEDISIDVSPGAALDGTNFFIVPGVKVRGGEEINTNSLFIGIFPGEIPTPFIPNGDIATIIFTISDDANPADFTDLDFASCHSMQPVLQAKMEYR